MEFGSATGKSGATSVLEDAKQRKFQTITRLDPTEKILIF